MDPMGMGKQRIYWNKFEIQARDKHTMFHLQMSAVKHSHSAMRGMLPSLWGHLNYGSRWIALELSEFWDVFFYQLT